MCFNCSSQGKLTDEKFLSRMVRSPGFDPVKNEFINSRPGISEQLMENTRNFGLIRDWFAKGGYRRPETRLSEVIPDMTCFMEPSGHARVIWFGHSTLLLRMSKKNILIDPMFSNAASPVGFMVKRFQKPVLPLSGLPGIDHILISHDHYDHLDKDSIKFFRDQKTQFTVPLGLGSHLVRWGIAPGRITELDWWESVSKGEIEFIAAPARHFSGRSLTRRNKTLWASWIIRDRSQSLYFSGDSGYDTHFTEIGEKYGPFDLAFMENGQYNVHWKQVHMMPRETAQACVDVKAKRLFPIHWGMFVLSMHAWYEPAEEITREAELREIDLITPKLGEPVTIDNTLKTDSWWQGLK